MHDNVANVFGILIDGLNRNQGVVSVGIFVVTLFLGWVSGIFSTFRRKPKLRIELIPGPTFSCTFLTGKKYGNFEIHRTAIALYLKIANVGSAPTSIENLSIGYHWHLRPFSWIWLRYRVFWSWLEHQAVALTDFQVKIGDNIKLYPFLFQRSIVSGGAAETYLEIGRSINGVAYFEQDESWGGFFPSPWRKRTRIIVAITDTFGSKHKRRFWIPVVELAEARKYNPSFGETLPALKRGPTPEWPSGDVDGSEAPTLSESHKNESGSGVKN